MASMDKLVVYGKTKVTNDSLAIVHAHKAADCLSQPLKTHIPHKSDNTSSKYARTYPNNAETGLQQGVRELRARNK